MSTQTIYLPPPSPYSADPVADAKSRIIARTGNSTFPASSMLAWADPQVAMGNGTGGWQFEICQEYTPPASQDSVIYCVQCGGNSASSVGASPAAPQPSFTGFTMQNSPLWSLGSGHITMSQTGTNGAMFSTILGPYSTNKDTDLGALATRWGATTTFWQTYYYDPQTAVGVGRGNWQLVWQYWGPQYNNMFSQVAVSGCTLSGVGVKGQPVPAFGGASRVSAPFKLI